MEGNKKINKFVAVSFVVFLVFFLHTVRIIQPLEMYLKRFIFPISTFFYQINSNLEIKNEVNKLSIDEYKKITEENIFLQLENSRINELEKTNKELRELLDFKNTTKLNLIGAEVVGKNIEQFGNSLLINKGEKSGIKLGLPVIFGDGILIGKIIKTTPEDSVVQLITDSQSKIAATVQNQERSMGLVEGGFGLAMQMTLIPQNEIIHVGDSIITSGLEKEIPRGLLIGTVESIEKEPYQAFQNAIVSPLLKFEKITVLGVIDYVK